MCAQDQNCTKQTARDSKTGKDVAIGELNCSFGQRDYKNLLNDSLTFWFDTPLRKTLIAKAIENGRYNFDNSFW